MKHLLLASFIVIPSITFAGGIGGVSLDDYNIVTTTATETSSLSESSEAPRATSARTTSARTTSSRERRRGYGFRLPSQRATGSTTSQRAGRRSSRNYWNWVDAQRTTTNATAGVTRAGATNFGDSYELANGLEPIDPNDNTFRGQSRETERQSAAQLKMLRLRSGR